jgi:tripartite-type tricarboxylate transporter receptor subunit TctC
MMSNAARALLLRPLALCASLLSLALSPLALAADGDYPSRPISIIVAYGPGGQGDTFARLVGERLTTVLKQPVLVDN